MGLIEMRDADAIANAINYLSGCSDKYFERAITIINRNRKDREEMQNSECAKRTEELIKELKANHWIFQYYDCYAKKWYNIDFDDIRIRREKD